MANKEYKIPFQQNSNLLSHAGYDNTYYDYTERKSLPIIWEDNVVFNDSFEYSGYSKGRSFCHIYLKSTIDNREHFVIIDDFDRMMKKAG